MLEAIHSGRMLLIGAPLTGGALFHARVNVLAFILSNNIARRHLNKGQQAILVALAYRSSAQ